MKSVIKSKNVHLSDAEVVRTEHEEVSPAAPRERCVPTPGVRLVRVEGRVQAIELTCRCGDVSVLEIEYAEDAPATEATS